MLEGREEVKKLGRTTKRTLLPTTLEPCKKGKKKVKMKKRGGGVRYGGGSGKKKYPKPSNSNKKKNGEKTINPKKE